jgi:hypothetical protein
MSSGFDHPSTHPNPRPGVLKALGICNIVFAILGWGCILWSFFFFIAASAVPPAKVEVKVDASTGPAKKGGVPMSAGFNPYMMMEDKNFIQWSYVANGTNLLLNGLMFATGIGLLNQRWWAARWWTIGSWIKLALIFILWGYYIVAVAPGFSETMARNAVAMFAQQGMPQGQAPTVAFMTRIYSIMNLIVAVGAILFSSIYPAISLWLLGRPGVKAAILDKPVMEPELP